MVVELHPKVKHPSRFLKERTGVARLNRALAIKIGNLFGSMGFFYFCVLLDLVELPAVIQQASVIIWVTYISQAVIQLVALPIISVQGNIQSEEKAASDNAMHEALTHIATQVDKIVGKK